MQRFSDEHSALSPQPLYHHLPTQFSRGKEVYDRHGAIRSFERARFVTTFRAAETVVWGADEPFQMRRPTVDEKPSTNVVRTDHARMIAVTIATTHLDVKTVSAKIA